MAWLCWCSALSSTCVRNIRISLLSVFACFCSSYLRLWYCIAASFSSPIAPSLISILSRSSRNLARDCCVFSFTPGLPSYKHAAAIHCVDCGVVYVNCGCAHWTTSPHGPCHVWCRLRRIGLRIFLLCSPPTWFSVGRTASILSLGMQKSSHQLNLSAMSYYPASLDTSVALQFASI